MASKYETLLAWSHHLTVQRLTACGYLCKGIGQGKQSNESRRRVILTIHDKKKSWEGDSMRQVVEPMVGSKVNLKRREPCGKDWTAYSGARKMK